MKGAATNASRDPCRTVLHADLNSGTRGRLTADPRKPGEILNGWQSRLDALALSEPDVAATLLQKVACGLAHLVGAPARREPRSVNTVDAHGANNKLLEATRKNKVEDLRELRRQGAIDFRAQAQHSAPTFEALVALQAPAQELTRTTTATTTLTTTTAITTTTAVVPDASEKTPIPPQG